MSTANRTLQDVRKELKVDWYRSRVEPALLRELTRRSDFQGLIQALGHFTVFLLTGAVAFWMWQERIWVGFGVAMFAHGTVATFFNGTAPHELGHGTVFRSKWLNKVFLYLFSLIGWWNPFDYALSHTYHHRYTLHPDGDQEAVLPCEPVIRVPFLLQIFTVSIYTNDRNSYAGGQG